MQIVSDKEALKRIAANARRLRGDRSLSQIARDAETYPASIRRIEEGQNMPGVGLLTRLAKALGASVDELLSPPNTLSRV